MTLNKQKRQLFILGSLFVFLGFTLYRLVFSSGTAPANTTQIQNPGNLSNAPLDLKDLYLKKSTKRVGGKKEISFREIDPSIHLEKLADFDPGEPLNARNMFSVGAPPPERNVATRTSSGHGSSNPEPGATAVNSLPQPVRPPAIVINLKFYGTKTDLIQRSLQGFFAEGDDVYLASEGDLVANRYRVIRIGDSSAEIEDVSSKTRRQINLLTQ